MDHTERFKEFELTATRSQSKFLTYSERDGLRKQLENTIDECLLAGDSARADSLYKHYAWLGGDTERVLDRRGVIELTGDLTRANSSLLARLVLRIAVDRDGVLELSPELKARLRHYFNELVKESDPVWRLLVTSPDAVNWLFVESK